MKLLKQQSDDGLELHYMFWCVGCKEYHAYAVKSKSRPDVLWQFNGDMEKPTFTPSLLMKWHRHVKFGGMSVCHLFVTDGKIIYCNDCTHELSGKTVDMVPHDDWKKDEVSE